MVVVADERRRRGVEDRRSDPLRMAGGEEERQRPTLGHSEDRGPFGVRGVHHGADVIHPGLVVGQPVLSVGEACPALVEQDQARE